MRLPRPHRPTPALAIASLALFVSIGGTSYAVITVGSSQIINNSVRSVDLRNNDVRSADVRNGSLRAADFKPGVLERSSAFANEMYAHVDETGTIDASRTTAGISAVKRQVGTFPFYCFDLPQTAKNISATVESTRTTLGGPNGFSLGPTYGTVDPARISADYAACPAGTDAVVLVPARPGGPDTPVYATFIE